MSSNKRGWIKLHRQIQDCWVWQDKEPFDMRSAWIDLLLSANHEDAKMLFDGQLITIERGQLVTSIRKLSGRWKWSKDKCLKFIRLLEHDGMLTKSSDTKRTLLTIVNYGNFQDWQDTDSSTVETLTGHSLVHSQDTDRTLTGHCVATNNNDNNVKKEDKKKNDKNDKKLYTDSDEPVAKPQPQKHKHGEYDHVLLTDDQRNRLFAEFGEAKTLEAIKLLDEYIQMKGYKAKDHNLAIRKWVFDAVDRQNQRNNSYQQQKGEVDIQALWRNA